MKEVSIATYLDNAKRIIDTVLPLLSERTARNVVVRNESIRVNLHVHTREGLSLIVDTKRADGVFVADVQMTFPSLYLPVESMVAFNEAVTVLRQIAQLIAEVHADTIIDPT